MKSKQSLQAGQNARRLPRARTVGELSGRLSDIELKLDHIIERIKGSLHRIKDDWEDKP